MPKMTYKKLFQAIDLFHKLADSLPNAQTLNRIVSAAIEELKSTNSAIMRGVKGISNLEMQPQFDYNHISFLLLVDPTAEANASNRQEVVKSSVSNALRKVFPGFEFHVDYTDFADS